MAPDAALPHRPLPTATPQLGGPADGAWDSGRRTGRERVQPAERGQLVAFVAQVTQAAWDRRLAPADAQVCPEGARLLAELRAAGGAR
jgi:hypothetical protein